MNIYGVQPSLFNATIDEFLKVKWQGKSALPLADQLYSPRGSQSIAVGSYVTDTTTINPEDVN